jgi:GST-like protein
MIDLYTSPTPNGHKISCALEAMSLDYNAITVNLMEGEQHKPEFLKISPNGKIPAIVDQDNGFKLAESGAILIYLADKTGLLLPADKERRARAIEWLMFQMGHIGPMMGQANVFFRYFPEKIQPAIDRYQNECRRLFEVLDNNLKDNEWISGEYSIADIANWCWVRTHNWSGVSIDGLEHLDRWKNAMYEQPGMKDGIKVPVPVENILEDAEKADEFSKNTQGIVTR